MSHSDLIISQGSSSENAAVGSVGAPAVEMTGADAPVDGALATGAWAAGATPIGIDASSGIKVAEEGAGITDRTRHELDLFVGGIAAIGVARQQMPLYRK